VLKELQVHKEYKVIPELKEYKVLKELQVHKEYKVIPELKEYKVIQVFKE
jgi:hypothetical protein